VAVSTLLIGLLGAAVASNQPAAISNFVEQTTGISAKAVTAADAELKKLEEADDAALEEIDGWIRENEKFAAEGAGIPKSELNQRIRKRLDEVRKSYEEFLKKYPTHADGHIAYASFLHDIGDEEEAEAKLEKARELDPNNAAAWNNLANHFGHRGPVKKAFEYYEKAISLDPTEPIYYQNFATTVYLFRKDAREHYGITEQEVFTKALDLYAQAMRLDPTNFLLATDLAQSYYGIRPVRTEDALQAWTNAFKLARDEIEREGVHIHLARFKLNDGRFDEARAHLRAVTNDMYAAVKERLTRNIQERETRAKETNSPPVAVEGAPASTGTDPSTNGPPRKSGQ
jgi:tetratricopeptide (TPR) repeat protein